MKKSYSELLKDTRWQRKKDQILERDDYKCTVCGSIQNLQVHHTFYYRIKIAPWLYPNKSLITLCNDCHFNWHLQNESVIKENKQKIKNKIPKKSKLKKILTKYNWFLNRFNK